MEVALGLLVIVGIGALCFKAAADKGRNGWFWGVVGAVAPFVGLLVVLLLPRIPRDGSA